MLTKQVFKTPISKAHFSILNRLSSAFVKKQESKKVENVALVPEETRIKIEEYRKNVPAGFISEAKYAEFEEQLGDD